MSNVYDLSAVRAKKLRDQRTSEGKRPLLVSHAEGKITSDENRPEFGDRLARIRASLEKINRLMSELKKMGEENNVDNSKNRY